MSERKAIRVLEEAAILAGEKALKKLSKAKPEPARITARAAISVWLPTIIKEQERGISLLRIYNDLEKAVDLGISYRSFQNYVGVAAKAARLKVEKKKADPAPVAASAPKSPKSPKAPKDSVAPALAPVLTAAENEAPEWNCRECETNMDCIPDRQTKTVFWQCKKCGMRYKDGPDGMPIKERYLPAKSA